MRDGYPARAISFFNLTPGYELALGALRFFAEQFPLPGNPALISDIRTAGFSYLNNYAIGGVADVDNWTGDLIGAGTVSINIIEVDFPIEYAHLNNGVDAVVVNAYAGPARTDLDEHATQVISGRFSWNCIR